MLRRLLPVLLTAWLCTAFPTARDADSFLSQLSLQGLDVTAKLVVAGDQYQIHYQNPPRRIVRYGETDEPEPAPREEPCDADK